MQRPTCNGMRVRSTADAQVIFHAVYLGILPMIKSRLNSDERREIRPGCVYVWEERSPNTEAGGMVGIERWTDSRSWGPSRVRDEFLFYHERERSPVELEMASDSDTTLASQRPSPPRIRRKNLVKQTYSVLVQTQRGRRKWHLTAYFTYDSVENLHTVDDFPELAALHVPPGKYISARCMNKNHKAMPVYPIETFGRDRIPRLFKFQTRPPLWINNNSEAQRGSLAPLAYLEKIAPHRRHPLDEKALMSFTCHFTRDYYRNQIPGNLDSFQKAPDPFTSKLRTLVSKENPARTYLIPAVSC